MLIEIKAPVLPESVADATVANWHKKPGEPVRRDENLVDIETDKVMLEVVAPSDGVIEEILKDNGATIKSEELLAKFSPKKSNEVEQTKQSTVEIENKQTLVQAPKQPIQAEFQQQAASQQQTSQKNLSPAVRRVVKENDLDPSKIQGTGKADRITRQDLDKFLETSINHPSENARLEKRVPMTRLRATIAERLLAAQHNAAILTTFNEINMQPVVGLRAKYKESFEQKYGVRLGLMSFFVTAVVAALKRFPAVNASIDGSDIVYHGYFDIGIAVSSPRGLVVPVLRDADTMTMAQIEQKIKEFSQKAQDGKLSIEEMTGGTFTITNGGVFGSLMATPILNPPQSGILGMHKIEERPVVENKEIVIRPMMYVALSYDHRIIDGAESVQFLVTVKELIEDPARLLLSI